MPSVSASLVLGLSSFMVRDRQFLRVVFLQARTDCPGNGKPVWLYFSFDYPTAATNYVVPLGEEYRGIAKNENTEIKHQIHKTNTLIFNYFYNITG